MHTTCECTLRRLIGEEEIQAVNHQLGQAGAPAIKGTLLAQIDRFSQRAGCPHLHRLDSDTGYCSCGEFILDWTAELGEKARLHAGRPL